MDRRLLIVLLVSIGAAMVVVGWVQQPNGYGSNLLLQLGTTLLLVAPLVWFERMLTRQLGEVRDELEDLQRRTHAIASTYEQARAEQESGASRTATLERQISQAREDGRRGEHGAAEVAKLFERGSDGERIAALGMMQGDHSLADVSAVVDGIAHSRSAFEQWHALKLAQQLWGTLGAGSRDLILAAVDVEMRPGGYLRPGTDRYALARTLKTNAMSARR